MQIRLLKGIVLGYLAHFSLCELLVERERSQDRHYGDFMHPAPRDRPRFRYWLPDASVDPDILKTDIASAGSIGAGGIELVPFYNYGGSLGGPPPGVDWSKYGFGTPAFLELFESALEAHAEARMVMDFAFGPSEGQGIPASPDDEGLQWDLVPSIESVPLDGYFNKTLPGWGTGNLVAAVSALVIDSANVTRVVSGLQGPMNVTHERLTLKYGTLTDVTDNIDSTNGVLATKFPRSQKEGRYRVFSFYEKRTLKRNLQFATRGCSTIWDNGSFVVDHFSARGANAIIYFWKKHILPHGRIKELLMKVGNLGWEDSMELQSNISWSPTLSRRFRKKFNYDLRPYLPLIAYGNNNINIQNDSPGIYQASLDKDVLGRSIVNDYREILADGYVEYLETLRSWLNGTLGLGLSVQPSYNLPMDMLSIIPHVDVPESESLQGQNNVDGYRQFTGPTNLASKRLISNELGGVFGRAYSFTIAELLQMANRGFAGGLNQFIIHGQSYSGNYTNTTWPGHVPFLYYASDLYNNKRPDWDHGMKDAMEYLGRVQYVQRQGVARTDVAIYNKNVTDPNFNDVYVSDDLMRGGWSYNYLSPDNFDLPEATVAHGVLAPTGPAYKAMVILSSQNLTFHAVQRIGQYAKAGLPIIFSGGVPGYHPTRKSTDKQAVERGIRNLTKMKGVHVVSNGAVARTLTKLGLRPQVAVRTDGICYTTWREDLETGIDYLYVFNDLAPASVELVVQSSKMPYILDPWTGNQSPLLYYHSERSLITIPLALAGNQTAVFAFAREPIKDIPVPKLHLTQVPSSVLGYGSDKRGVYLHVAGGKASTNVRLSTGKAITLVSKAPLKFKLSHWKLTVELWEAPKDMYKASAPAIKRNLTEMSLEHLVSWADMPTLHNASGIGYYKTTFSWSERIGNSVGAYIKFLPALNVIVLDINGKRLPPLDGTTPMIDITPYLVQGDNEVLAIVPSTMWNYIRSMIDDVESGGLSPIIKKLGIPGPLKNGLVGAVQLIPYEKLYII